MYKIKNKKYIFINFEILFFFLTINNRIIRDLLLIAIFYINIEYSIIYLTNYTSRHFQAIFLF